MNQQKSIRFPASPTYSNALSIFAETSKVVGEKFFPLVVEGLAEALSVRWAFICQVESSRSEQANTLANWDNGPAENFVYDLANTPCADVTTNGVCCYADDIASLYPLDDMLVELGAKSYAGVALRSSEGKILGLIAVLDDKPFPDPELYGDIVSLFSGKAAAELERLSASSLNERLGKIVEASVSESYVFARRTFLFELVNQGARDNLGYSMEELRLLTPWDLKPEYSREEFIEFVQPLILGEVRVLRFETVHQRKDRTTYPVSVSLQFYPDEGDVFFASITNETERKKHAERERLILNEMNHRAKNILAVVQVLARQSTKRSPEDYLERFEARVAALAASHDVLVHNQWKDVPLGELIRLQLGHFGHLIGKRIFIDGPDTKIEATVAQGLGLALHELSTNASKYGALSNEIGRVTVSWREFADESGRNTLEVIWSEADGPTVVVPTSRGFGSLMIERSLATQFGCEVTMDFDPAGLSCRFKARDITNCA